MSANTYFWATGQDASTLNYDRNCFHLSLQLPCLTMTYCSTYIV